MAMNTHYSGRMEKAILRTLKEAAGREGKFYQIFNKYGYYDVNDEQNGLTKEQREQVPIENQTRFTQFANALVEMFAFVLSDGQYGVITKDMQNIVDKLDIRSSANNAQLNAIGNGLSSLASSTAAFAPLASVDASRKIADTQTTMTMGSNPFNADLIPPIAIGLDGLPVSIANVFKPGFFQPNWDFLYQQEPIKSSKFYDSGDGKMRIGCNILLDQGGDKRDLFLKNIFAVNTTDKDLQPLGDVKGGLSAEEYEIVRTASTANVSILTSDDVDETNSKIRSFRLNDSQIQASFFKYVQLKLWGAINNKKNWAHSHWGALTHNSCPEYVKSAVCSFLWTNGLSIESGKSDESAFISYCLYMGINYLIGYQYSVSMYPIVGVDKVLSDKGSVIVVENAGLTANEYGIVVASNGLPKDTAIANQYFTWIADILMRLTASNNAPETDIALRKRRVAEANLIYKGLGHPTVTYGDPISKLDYFHTEGGLKDRKFDKLIGAKIFRYANEGSAGGVGTNGALVEPAKDAVTINYDATANSSVVTELTLNVLRYLCVQAGVREIYITSTYRPPEIQLRAMFNNLQSNNRVSYGPAGRAVVDIYDNKKKSYGVGYTSPLKDASQVDSTKKAMLDKINASPPEKVSKHAAHPTVVQALDISPTRMYPLSRKASFRAVCMQALKDGVLRAFLGPKPEGPGSDPAFHIEIWQNGNGNTEQYSSAPAVNNALPTVLFNMSNPNLRKSTSWLNPIAKDHVDSVNASNGNEDQA